MDAHCCIAAVCRPERHCRSAMRMDASQRDATQRVHLGYAIFLPADKTSAATHFPTFSPKSCKKDFNFNTFLLYYLYQFIILE